MTFHAETMVKIAWIFYSAKIYLTWHLEAYIDGVIIGAWRHLYSRQKLFMKILDS